MLVLGDPRTLAFVVGIERGGKFVIQFSCMCVNSVQFSVFWDRDFTVCMKFVAKVNKQAIGNAQQPGAQVDSSAQDALRVLDIVLWESASSRYGE